MCVLTLKKRTHYSQHALEHPFADLDPLYPDQPVPGANDGASGTAVLLEMINHIDQFPNDPAVDIIFWDAEDMGISGTGAYFCQGSEYYSKNLFEPVAEKGILIDMIGDQDLQVPIEINSMKYAPDLVLEIWDIAYNLAYQHVFPKRTGYEIHDDHIPLNQIAGIPTIVLIDFDYTHRGRNLWHTTHDLPSYCSPGSLQIIADVLITWLLRQ
ncbi:MAG: M28 family peptidase [Candidatus Marinimicrobia bacterium]|nr:M28 family peptidase [Candidatus Neomarinimicrobiota bacterium]